MYVLCRHSHTRWWRCCISESLLFSDCSKCIAVFCVVRASLPIFQNWTNSRQSALCIFKRNGYRFNFKTRNVSRCELVSSHFQERNELRERCQGLELEVSKYKTKCTLIGQSNIINVTKSDPVSKSANVHTHSLQSHHQQRKPAVTFSPAVGKGRAAKTNVAVNADRGDKSETAHKQGFTKPASSVQSIPADVAEDVDIRDTSALSSKKWNIFASMKSAGVMTDPIHTIPVRDWEAMLRKISEYENNNLLLSENLRKSEERSRYFLRLLQLFKSFWTFQGKGSGV